MASELRAGKEYNKDTRAQWVIWSQVLVAATYNPSFLESQNQEGSWFQANLGK
jgi:hypothetical protein